MEIRATDYHTAGEPFRIVTAGAPEIAGATVLERRERARSSEAIDVVRRLLCHEPRGHADMYGCFPVPPDDEGADLGVLFWHKDGYSTACGHGTIALGAWAVESGLVAAPADGEVVVRVDVPSGRVVARVRRRAGSIEAVTFGNVPAFVLARERPAAGVMVDVAYGGAIYASAPAASFGLRVVPADLPALIAAGREVQRALADTEVAAHPHDPRLSGVYGTILFEEVPEEVGAQPAEPAASAEEVVGAQPAEPAASAEEVGAQPAEPAASAERGELHQRNVTIFADGEVDRSPCGSGTSARCALLAEEGLLGDGRVLRHDSIVGSSFRARVVEHTAAGVVTEVEGMAYRTAEHRFVLDPRDPLGTGFVLR